MFEFNILSTKLKHKWYEMSYESVPLTCMCVSIFKGAQDQCILTAVWHTPSVAVESERSITSMASPAWNLLELKQSCLWQVSNAFLSHISARSNS